MPDPRPEPMPRDEPATSSPAGSPPPDGARRIERPEYVGTPDPRDTTDGDPTTPPRSSGSGRAAGSQPRRVEAVGAAIRPGVTTDELDAIAHDFLVAHDAYPRRSATAASEIDLHLGQRGASATASPTTRAGRRRHHQHRHHRLPRRHARRPRPHVPGRRGRRREAAAWSSAPGRRWTRHPRGRAGAPINVIGRAIEATRIASATGSSATSPVTGSGEDSTRGWSSRTTTPRPTSAPHGGRAWCSRSSRCSRSARPSIRGPSSGTNGTTVDRRHPRPQPDRPVRAHPRRDRARRRDPDPALIVMPSAPQEREP